MQRTSFDAAQKWHGNGKNDAWCGPDSGRKKTNGERYMVEPLLGALWSFTTYMEWLGHGFSACVVLTEAWSVWICQNRRDKHDQCIRTGATARAAYIDRMSDLRRRAAKLERHRSITGYLDALSRPP